MLRLPAAGSPLGLAFGFLLRPFETLRLTFYPLIVASQAIPIIVFAPILVVWFGYGIGPKLAVVALVCFFPIAVTTADGLRAVDPRGGEDDAHARRLTAASCSGGWKRRPPSPSPSAAPGSASPSRRSPPSSASGSASDSGLGHLILQDNAQLETARVFAAALVLSAIAIGLYGLVALAERRVVTWR